MTKLACCFLIACGSSPVAESPDAAPDAPPVGECADGEHIKLAGAVALDVRSAGAATRSGKVIGIVGAPTPERLYTLATRSVLTADLDALGDHDIAQVNLKYLDKITGSDCPTSCTGLFALAGTFTVLENSPRYRATFTLTDLYQYDGDSNDLGPSVAGTITGCVNANR